jgi:hypothetical protein
MPKKLRARRSIPNAMTYKGFQLAMLKEGHQADHDRNNKIFIRE